MIAAARQKPLPFHNIVVWKFSRFSRNREDSVLYKRMLERNRVRVVSLNEPVDDSPAGRMLEAILESVDEFYSQNLAQDIIRGLRKNASMGFRNGGPPPIGYRKKRTGPSEGAPRIKKTLGASACDAKSLPKDETEAAVIDLLRDELLTPAYIKHLVDLVNEEADAAGAFARAEVDAVAAQLAEAKRRLDNLYRAIEDGALDLSILAPRIREVKTHNDELTATHAALAAAGTPVMRLADDATITRYVERLQTALATGSVNTQRAILRSWISRIEADGTT